jgi:glycine dehydrogenase subunit 2
VRRTGTGAGAEVIVDDERPHTVGRVRSFFGNFGMMVRAYAYMRELGPEGLAAVSNLAVLNARYVAARLVEHFPLAFSTPALHEAVFTDRELEAQTGVKTLDVAKRLIDYGMHPPTVYFPLVVRGALMVEPTETETKQTLDEFVAAMASIAKEARETPELLKQAPHLTRMGRLDEARAARKPRLRWTPEPTS